MFAPTSLLGVLLLLDQAVSWGEAIYLCALDVRGRRCKDRIHIAVIMLMSLMLPTLDSSSIRRLPQYFGFVAGSNRSVSSKVLRLMSSLMPRCLHSGTSGLQPRRWDPLAPLPRSNLGLTGSLQISIGFTSGLWTPFLYPKSLY